LGRESFDVAVPGTASRVAHLAPGVRDMDYLVSVAHLTGHMVTGFGGTLKNLGMGLASRAGKLDQHSAVSPSVAPEKCVLCLRCMAACPAGAISEEADAARIASELCIGCAECLAVCPEKAIRINWGQESGQVQRSVAEYAAAILHALDRRAVFINLLNQITKDCDCLGHTGQPLVGDVGIAASSDPVALDQASLDWVREIAGRDLFAQAWPDLKPEIQLQHAEGLGLGSRRYQRVPA
jgi:uncharacterized Fe-S center protein